MEGEERDNPSASSFVQIDPDLDNAPPPPAFSPTSGPIQCKYPTSRLLYIRLYEVTDHGRPSGHLKSYGTVCWTTQGDSPAGPTAPEWWPPRCLCSHEEVA
ncbi:unnamed protein product [Arctogadus glacialis]